MFIHQPYSFPVIKQITNSDGTRYYVNPDGKEYPSVTTLLSKMHEGAIEDWKRRVGEEAAEEKKNISIRRGKATHLILENFINNKSDYAAGQVPSNLFMFNALKPHLIKHLSIIHNQEFSIYSDILRIAGTADLFAQWDGIPTIIDYKTSAYQKEEAWITNYFFQAALYAAMIYERIQLKVLQIVLLIMCEHDNPQIIVKKTSEYLADAIRFINKVNKSTESK